MKTHRYFRHSLAMAILILAAVSPAGAEEGMYPMSELGKLDLEEAGLSIDQTDIYNPDGLAIVDGIVKLGGCTGSFVSDQGLILTNHHCAYGAIRNASTADRDFLNDGFSATASADEFPAVGFTVRITENYWNVSVEVLSAVTPEMSPLERTRAIEKKMKEISLDQEKKNPGMRAEVNEMFIGKDYVLFLYTYLKDVRLVYAPPQDLAKFGGEIDNWIWPRHSGDFAFMRAYVGPDGSPAEYSEQNVPYRPKKVLQVSGAGVDDGDAVFILGYPGRTYRHRPAAFIDYMASAYMPYIVDWYGWQIDMFETLSRESAEHRLALSSRLRSLHNTHKNFRGKLQGISRLHLVIQKTDEETKLQEFIDTDPARQEVYGQVLPNLDSYYEERAENLPGELWLGYMLRSTEIMRAARTVWENAQEKTKPETERERPYMDRNLAQTINGLKNLAKRFDAVADRQIMAELLARGGGLDQAEQAGLVDLTGEEGATAADNFLKGIFSNSKLMEEEYLLQAMDMSTAELRELGDPFLGLAEELYEPWVLQREDGKRRKGILDPLQAALADVSREYFGAGFVPDANGTLRLTYGRIEGYSPRDAVWLTPLTTVEGLLEKDTGLDPFALPLEVKEQVTAGDFGSFASEELGGVPVNILYSTDTTGGNSGSPVFNASGEVVGLNFDRAWEATINDYAWDHSYSRSIGVDIRYVLWVTWKIGGANRLLAEMGVTP